MANILVPTGICADGQETALSTWFYAAGDTVETGAVVAEVMVEKTSYEIIAPVSGVLGITVQEDTVVSEGQVLGQIQ